MLENDRLRRAWDELPKTPHVAEITTRHSDVLPEWIIQIIESPDSYEWTEYATASDGALTVRTILLGLAPENDFGIEVVFDG